MEDNETSSGDEPHVPSPTVWPIGFAIGIATLLVGLIVNPLWISTIGAAIAIVFGVLWARAATSELRGRPVDVEPERRDLTAPAAPTGATATAPPAAGERFPRNRFLEGTTLGLGALIGGVLTVPVAGFALLPAFLKQKKFVVDLGSISDYAEGQWYVTTFTVDPTEVEVSRRTAFIRNNGLIATGGKQAPSFTIISNRCVHLGCPVQANGPSGAILGMKTVKPQTPHSAVSAVPSVPAGFGCPCHGGQYDTEGNRTAGPPVRALDRYEYSIANGRLLLTSRYSVSHVDGTGAQAKIHKYKSVGPGEHVDGWEQIFYPLNPPHN
jgi:Rieske Fe-S protein